MKKDKLSELWKKTKDDIDTRENEITNIYISFLRKVAKHYLKLGAKVYFHENTVVHYGEGGFGRMLIESQGNHRKDLGGYYSRIGFTPKNITNVKGYEKISLKNLNEIKYNLYCEFQNDN